MYGSPTDDSQLAANLYNTIMFNTMDQIRMKGIINTVSIHFCTAPEIDQPEISFFVVESTRILNAPNTFQIVSQHQLKSTIEKLGTEMTFDVGEISVDRGQYLAVRFAPGSGNPYTTKQNQYYRYFEEDSYNKQRLEFIKCRTRGIAMNFNVQPC